jgi:hypothetical protein
VFAEQTVSAPSSIHFSEIWDMKIDFCNFFLPPEHLLRPRAFFSMALSFVVSSVSVPIP